MYPVLTQHLFLALVSRVAIIAVRAPLQTSHVPRLPICCDAGKALSPTFGLEALPWGEQRRQRAASGKSFIMMYF